MSISQDSIPRSAASLAAAIGAVPLAVTDANFTITGSSDATKTLKFEVDGMTANDDLTINSGAQTDDRTITIPVLAGNDTFAALGVANTFTENLAQTGAKTFSTGTGAVSLNGSTTVATGKTLTLTDIADTRFLYSVSNVVTGSAVLTQVSGGIIVNLTGGQTLLTVGDNAASSYGTFRIKGGSGKYNYQFGANDIADQTLTIGPSTAVDGTTFSTASIKIAGATHRLTLGVIGTTCPGQIIAGVQDATADTAGERGETLVSTVSGVAAGSSGAAGNITSLAVTRGKWRLSGFNVVSGGATGLTSGSTVKLSITSSSAANGTSGANMTQESVLALLAGGLFEQSIPDVIINIAADTTYYMTAEITYVAGSPTYAGTFTAERIR